MKTKRIFNQLLKPYKTIIKYIFNDYTTVRVTTGSSFCAWCRDDEDLEINVPIFEKEMGAKAFQKKMQKRLKEFKIQGKYSPELLSFLHEIGHIQTYNKWNDFKYILGTHLITALQATKLFRNSYKLTNWCFQKYFNLKLEYNADKWAMEFIKHNRLLCKQWDKMIHQNYVKYLPKLMETMGLELV